MNLKKYRAMFNGYEQSKDLSKPIYQRQKPSSIFSQKKKDKELSFQNKH